MTRGLEPRTRRRDENSPENLRLNFEKVVEGRFIDRMDQNGAIFERVMSDPQLKEAVTSYLLRKLYECVREKG